MIKVENILFKYSEQFVLNDISFKLKRGETLSIVGASGCGKSTLLRIISGILPNNKVNQLFGLVSIDGLTPNEYRKTGKLSFMFQENTLMPNLNVIDNIRLPLKIKNSNNDSIVQELIHTVGLSEYSNYLPRILSGGMKTRVALARSFVTNPGLLLLDEPFSSLDIAWKSKLYIELENLRKQSETTIIMVTHDVQEALLLSNHVLVINNMGEIESYHEISTNESISERVNDISAFMSEVYTDYMLPIQQAIINGKNKKNEKANIISVI